MKLSADGYAVGDRLQVTIEQIVPGGSGLARGPHGVVLVELCAPGDLLEIEIESLRRGTARGRIVEVIEPGAGRVDPPCRWYGTCGGCDFQHLAYDAQLDAKEAILSDALERIGGIGVYPPIQRFAAPEPFGSRSRVELHSDPATGAVGFFARRSTQVIDIDRCMVCRPELQEAMTAVRASRRPRPESIHLLGAAGVVHSSPVIPPIEGGPFWISIGGLDYLVHPAGFFQSSLDLLPAMIERVVASSGPERGTAWDLFSGVGLFSLPLARRYREVTGVELHERATANAVKGAERNGIDNTHFVAADVEQWLGNRRQRNVHPDLVVVDPPRTGLGAALATRLRDRRLPRLTYVSCDPTTLARDLKILLAGNLGIDDIAIFDLFPQTHHVETIVRLVDRRTN